MYVLISWQNALDADIQSEDKIANNLKQVLGTQLGLVNTRLDGLTGGALSGEVAQRIETSIKSNIGASIQSEIKKS